MTQEFTGVCADQSVALTSYLESLLSSDYFAPPTPTDVSQPALVNTTVAPVSKAPAAPLTCFVFSISGLKLAIPLNRVTAILDYPRPPSPSDVVEHQGRSLPLLDIARVVMPQTSISEPYRYLVVVDGRCAWACHKVDTVIEVMSDVVRWKSERTKRRWLAGMIATPPCALLDVEELIPVRIRADTVA